MARHHPRDDGVRIQVHRTQQRLNLTPFAKHQTPSLQRPSVEKQELGVLVTGDEEGEGGGAGARDEHRQEHLRGCRGRARDAYTWRSKGSAGASELRVSGLRVSGGLTGHMRDWLSE